MIEDVVRFIDYLVRLSNETQGQVSDERLFRILQFGVASYGELTSVRCGCACGGTPGVNNVGAVVVRQCDSGQDEVVEVVGTGEESGEGSERVGSGQSRSAESGRCGNAGVVNSPVRGPNYVRNKANRDARKRRKAERKSLGVDWRKREVVTVARDVGGGSKGFWNSCSDSVRQELIDSKARMHIARNEEEIRKCKAAKAKEESPETLLRNVFRIIELGEKKTKEVNNVKVSNWMSNVATGCAETMASSAPSSLPSFKELSEKLAASSQSSFDLTLHAKDVEIQELKDALEFQKVTFETKIEDLSDIIDDLRLSETMAENRFSCLAKPKVKKPAEPKFFTADQQRNHRQLTVRDMNGPFFH